jgi:hypothetical protein
MHYTLGIVLVKELVDMTYLEQAKVCGSRNYVFLFIRFLQV